MRVIVICIWQRELIFVTAPVSEHLGLKGIFSLDGKVL